MLVVPVQKDIIETIDGNTYKVVEYTNYKEAGPAVYARSKSSKELVLVYFIDIAYINQTKVEFQKSSKVFNALGKIDREQHLPQPDDKLTILSDNVSVDKDESEKIDVIGLKLKSKSLGVNRGMFVKDAEGNAYRLKQILDIKRSLGGSKFNREEFLTYYKDYIGV